MGGGIPKSAESSEAVSDGREGAGKSGSDVYGSGKVSALVRQQELDSNWRDAQGTGGVTPTGGTADYGADGKMWGRRRVGEPPGSGGNR